MNATSTTTRSIRKQAKFFAAFDFLIVAICVLYGLQTNSASLILIGAGFALLACVWFLYPVNLNDRLHAIFATHTDKSKLGFGAQIAATAGLILCVAGAALVFL